MLVAVGGGGLGLSRGRQRRPYVGKFPTPMGSFRCVSGSPLLIKFNTRGSLTRNYPSSNPLEKKCFNEICISGPPLPGYTCKGESCRKVPARIELKPELLQRATSIENVSATLARAVLSGLPLLVLRYYHAQRVSASAPYVI